MKRFGFVWLLTLPVLFFLLHHSWGIAHGTYQKTETSVQQGISYATWWSGNYASSDADLALQRLADTGADWISLIVTQYQDDISATDIYTTTATPTDSDLVHVIEAAHDLGLQVMLKPHVDLWDDPSHWRGQIGIRF